MSSYPKRPEIPLSIRNEIREYPEKLKPRVSKAPVWFRLSTGRRVTYDGVERSETYVDKMLDLTISRLERHFRRSLPIMKEWALSLLKEEHVVTENPFPRWVMPRSGWFGVDYGMITEQAKEEFRTLNENPQIAGRLSKATVVIELLDGKLYAVLDIYGDHLAVYEIEEEREDGTYRMSRKDDSEWRKHCHEVEMRAE